MEIKQAVLKLISMKKKYDTKCSRTKQKAKDKKNRIAKAYLAILNDNKLK